MAEFVQVTVQARRMCNKCGENCFVCPLNSTGDCILMLDNDNACDSDYAKTEDIVMQWAKEHPEPVYPSWAEGWKQLFPYGDDVPCLGLFDTKYYDGDCMERSCTKCKNAPMPAEIAEKLGIKPKEASK